MARTMHTRPLLERIIETSEPLRRQALESIEPYLEDPAESLGPVAELLAVYMAGLTRIILEQVVPYREV